MIRGILTRTFKNQKQTLGFLTLVEDGVVIWTCDTLELPWKENQRRVSCIPEGDYRAILRESDKYGQHYHIRNVMNRTLILIHAGNFYRQTKGCVLVGKHYSDIDGDGNRDVLSSRVTLASLLQHAPEEFRLTVQGAF